MSDKLSILPVSVIDVEAQTKKKTIRQKGEGDFGDSSRKIMSHHPEETSKLVYELFLRDATWVFDPFAGFGQRGYWANHYGKPYTGYDISQPNIDFAKENFGVENTLADSLHDDLPVFDGVYTCPPYWNLEVYDGDNKAAGDKIKTWEAFLQWYSVLWNRIIDAAPSGTQFCIQVGNWRAKKVFYDLEYHTQRIFENAGCECVDKVIISRKKVSKIKIMLPQAKRLGYTVKVHETLLVYKKP